MYRNSNTGTGTDSFPLDISPWNISLPILDTAGIPPIVHGRYSAQYVAKMLCMPI